MAEIFVAKQVLHRGYAPAVYIIPGVSDFFREVFKMVRRRDKKRSKFGG
jgi:hypothetical protein